MDLNAYKIMWLVVFFDLPVGNKKLIKIYTQFRKKLLKDGFTMYQYSVYMRHCASLDNCLVHEVRIETNLPQAGHISVLKITDRQFGNIKNFWGKHLSPPPKTPQQLEIF